MTITAALVLFSVTWFMVFFCVLPMRFKSQAQAGEVSDLYLNAVPGLGLLDR